jgi:uncharacterized protein YtpQ (UPF0354 family)
VLDGDALNIRINTPGIQLPDADLPVFRCTKGVFGVAYLVDEGQGYTHVTKRDLQEAAMSLEDLHQIGMRNLFALAKRTQPPLRLVPRADCFAVVQDGQFEASLVLLDVLWDQVFKDRTPNGIVMAIPARDSLLFCDRDSKTGMDELKMLVQRAKNGNTHFLSDALFTRKDGTWAAL